MRRKLERELSLRFIGTLSPAKPEQKDAG
jgi:hypothetical protein